MTSGVSVLSRLATAAQGLLILWLAIGPVLGGSSAGRVFAASPVSLPVSQTENEEEQNTTETRSAVEWVAPLRSDRRVVEPSPIYPAFLPPASGPLGSPVSPLLRPTSADPFRNGLGSPYLC